MYSSLPLLPPFLLIFLSVSVSISPFPQAKVDNEILNYKDLAALPKIKAIYEVQRPDLISYEPYHRYTSDETLERYSYGEVLSLRMPKEGLRVWQGLRWGGHR